MEPIEVFNQNFKNAEALLSLDNLLLEKNNGRDPEGFKEIVCQHFSIPDDEETIVILNEMLHALVREGADLRRPFFTERNLNLLLRQAVVATCSAMDVYFNDILKDNIMKIFQNKGRYSPKKLLKIEMTLDEYLSIKSYVDPEGRLKEIVLTKFDKITLGNVNGITETIEGYLGITEYWKRVSERLDKRQQVIKDDIDAIVKRRNDIIHRGDRKKNITEIDPEIQEMNYDWAYSHIHSVKSLVLATDAILRDEMREIMIIEEGIN